MSESDQTAPETPDDLVTLAGRSVDGYQIVVVKIHAVRAHFAKHCRNLVWAQCRPHEIAERIAAAISDSPQAECEFVLGFRCICSIRRGHEFPLGSPTAKRFETYALKIDLLAG